MSKFPIIENCIDKLKEMLNSLQELQRKNEKDDGFNCAVSCIKDSIQTRIDLLNDAIIDNDVLGDMNEEAECIAAITSAISVLESDVEDASQNTDFDIAFREKIKEFINKFYDILDEYE